MIHRDVYFNGTELPDDVAHVATPEDLIALATGQQTSSNANDDWRIYDYLEQHCDPAQGCQTMTITHNSNQSNGAMISEEQRLTPVTTAHLVCRLLFEKK